MVGTTYADLDATISSPQADLNLGILASADAVSSTPIADIGLRPPNPASTPSPIKATDQAVEMPRIWSTGKSASTHFVRRAQSGQDGRREVDRLAGGGGDAIPPIGKYRS